MSRFTKFMPSRRWLFLPPILVGVLVVGYLARSKKELTRIEPAERATELLVRRVQRQSVPAVAIGHGTASPIRTWSAIAEVGGRIVQTHPSLRSGIAVNQGDLLLAIDPTDYDLQIRQRQADLAQAESQLRQIDLDEQADQKSLDIQNQLLQVRMSDVNRQENLKARTAASQSQFDSAKAMMLQQSQTVQTLINALTTYSTKRQSAKAAIETAEARLAEAQRNLERTQITAPFAGLMSDVSLEVGQYVAPGQQLANVLDTSSVEIEAQFSVSQLFRLTGIRQTGNENQHLDTPIPSSDRLVSNSKLIASAKDLSSMRNQIVGQSNPTANATDLNNPGLALNATVTASSGDVKMIFSGKPIRFVSALDEETRTLGTIIRVTNPAQEDHANRRIYPGAYCEVKLTADEDTQAFVIPRTSVSSDTVGVLDVENRLRRRAIKTEFILGDDIAVSEGLLEGELLILNPPAVLLEGELIRPVFEEATLSHASEVSDNTSTRRSGGGTLQ